MTCVTYDDTNLPGSAKAKSRGGEGPLPNTAGQIDEVPAFGVRIGGQPVPTLDRRDTYEKSKLLYYAERSVKGSYKRLGNEMSVCISF